MTRDELMFLVGHHLGNDGYGSDYLRKNAGKTAAWYMREFCPRANPKDAKAAIRVARKVFAGKVNR